MPDGPADYRDDLENIAESELPCNWIAEAILETIDPDDDNRRRGQRGGSA